MIDFHSHIIPNVDDGSMSVEETFDLLSEAKVAGFDAIISTSHYIENSYESPANEREVWINALQENIDTQKIELKLYLGNEIYFTPNIIKLLEERKAVSINNSNYVLFEFPLNTKPMNIYDVVYDMIADKIIPVLAHPERYSFVQKEPELIYDLIQAGVMMQSNYGSILGKYGEKAQIIVKRFFQNNMVHFLGTDVHKPRTIYPKVQEALNEIQKIVGEKKLEELTTINPKFAIENKKIDYSEPKPIKLSIKEKIMLSLKR